jgi:hypothetical protein
MALGMTLPSLEVPLQDLRLMCAKFSVVTNGKLDLLLPHFNNRVGGGLTPERNYILDRQ